MIFKGSCTALVTPLSKDAKRIDFVRFKKIINEQIAAGTNALLFLGTTGTPATLTEEEKAEVIKFAVKEVNHRVPVLAGASSNNTKIAVLTSQKYELLGVDALLHTTPYYNKCTQGGLIAHFSAIADSVKIPVLLYNVPGRTNVNILPQTVLTLSKHKNIAGIKEASGNLEQITEIVRLCGKDFAMYSGDDALILPTLSIGGHGVISVASNLVPKTVAQLCEAFFADNLSLSQTLQYKLMPLVKMLFCEVNPIPVVTALHILGKTSSGLRLPLTPMEKENAEKLKAELANIGLI